MTRRRIVIIGGGITGLSAAYALKRTFEGNREVCCTVLEACDRLGGKISTHREDGLVMELGPDSLLARKQAGADLIRDLGVGSEVVGMNPSVGKTYMMHDGKLEEMPAGTNMGVPTSTKALWNTPLVSQSGKIRSLLDLVLPRTGSAEPDQSLGLFLRRRLGNEWVTQVCEPLMAGIYAAKLDDLSLKATFPQFADLEHQYGSLIRGSAKQRSAQLASAKALLAGHKTPSAHGRSAFITLRDGLQTLVEQLHSQLRDWADLRTQTEVTKIEHSGKHYAIHMNSKDGQETVEAEGVIVCTPAFVAGQLLCALSPTAATLSAIRYVSTATVILGYQPRALGDFEGSGFLVPRTEKSGITACTWTSNKWPHTASDGRVLIRCYVGRSGQHDGLCLDDESMAKMVHLELGRVMGIREQPWFSKVTRWDKAMPQPEVGHLTLVKSVEESLLTDTPGLFIAGAGYHGIGVPDCIQSGNNAAANVASWVRNHK